MVDAVTYIINLFFSWLGLFAAPAQNFEMLWILVPVWISWVFTEFYQEKRGTSLGNAISNGVVPLWVGIDWGKTTYIMFTAGKVGVDIVLAAKFGIIFFMIAYGLLIIIEGARGAKITKYIGRIREVTYFVVVLTPVVYGVVPLTADVILAIFAFFPLFYAIVEIIDRILPTPEKIYEEEGGAGLGGGELPSTGEPELPSMETPAEPQLPQQYPTYPQQYQQQQYPQQYPQQYQRYPRQPGT